MPRREWTKLDEEMAKQGRSINRMNNMRPRKKGATKRGKSRVGRVRPIAPLTVGAA